MVVIDKILVMQCLKIIVYEIWGSISKSFVIKTNFIEQSNLKNSQTCTAIYCCVKIFTLMGRKRYGWEDIRKDGKIEARKLLQKKGAINLQCCDQNVSNIYCWGMLRHRLPMCRFTKALSRF